MCGQQCVSSFLQDIFWKMSTMSTASIYFSSISAERGTNDGRRWLSERVSGIKQKVKVVMLRVGWFALSVTVSHLKCRRCWESFFGPWVCWERSGGTWSGKTSMVLGRNRNPSALSPHYTQLLLTPALVLAPIILSPPCVSHFPLVVPQRGQTKVSSVAVDLCVLGRWAWAAVFVGVHIVQSGTVSVRPHPWHWSGRVAHTLVWRTSSTQWMGGQSHPLCLSQSSLLCTGTSGENTAPDPGDGPRRYSVSSSCVLPPLLSQTHSSAQPLTPLTPH